METRSGASLRKGAMSPAANDVRATGDSRCKPLDYFPLQTEPGDELGDVN